MTDLSRAKGKGKTKAELAARLSKEPTTQEDRPSMQIAPYVISKIGPYDRKKYMSVGEATRLVCFDFDLTLTAIPVHEVLRTKAGGKGGNLLEAAKKGTVTDDEIWGGSERLTYVKRAIRRLVELEVYLVVLSHGSGELIDYLLQRCGLRRYIKGIFANENIEREKLLTVRRLMNTVFDDSRLAIHESVLVDDETEHCFSKLSPEEDRHLEPHFKVPGGCAPNRTRNADRQYFKEGHLVGPVGPCKIMCALDKKGLQEWQFDELIEYAA